MLRSPSGDGPAGIAAGGGGVWVTDNLDEQGLVGSTPQSNTEVRRIPVGAGPTAIAYGARARSGSRTPPIARSVE